MALRAGGLIETKDFVLKFPTGPDFAAVRDAHRITFDVTELMGWMPPPVGIGV